MQTELFLPQKNIKIHNADEIKKFLQSYDIEFSRWQAACELSADDTQETILKAYEHEVGPYMKKHGFQSCDVINVSQATPDISALRKKFLQEHTHSENEVRFFVDGAGVFWFHLNDGVVAKLTCVKGDFLSVPQGFKHWFDLAPYYFVKAIRIFTNKEGWVAQYTGSTIAETYLEGHV